MPAIIIGIDPSLNSTGVAVLQCEGNSLRLLEHYLIKPPSGAKSYIEKIINIGSKVGDIIKKHPKCSVAMEKTVCNVNPGSSLKLGMVRGAIIYSVSCFGILIDEYEPKTIKSLTVGNGNASKEQVAFMIGKILGIGNSDNKSLGFDITDAAAVAISHFNVKDSVIYKLHKGR